MPRVKKIRRGDRRHIRVQQVWNILTSLATAHRLGWSKTTEATYPDLAEAMGYDRRAGRTLGPHLGTISKFCMDNQLPCLNALVEHMDGTPGTGLLVYQGQSHADAKREALRFNWMSLRTPSPSAFREAWDTWEAEYSAPPKPKKQIELLRELVDEFDDDDDAIIEAYAEAERDGLVIRRSNDHGLSAEEYGRMYLRRARSRGQL